MKYFITTIVFLAIFWLALSGHYTALLLCLGAFCCIWVGLISRRMDIVDLEGHQIRLVSLRIIPYFIWLAKEIIVSSVIVARMILSPKIKLNPAVERLPAEGMSDMEKVIYANSITLTPGTLTLEVSDSWLEVHTIRGDLLDSLRQGEMANRIRMISIRKQPEK